VSVAQVPFGVPEARALKKRMKRTYP